MSQLDPNNEYDINNNPGAPYVGPSDGAPGDTLIRRRGALTRFYGTGALTASRVWKFATAAGEGWTDGDFVILSMAAHAGAGFTVTVETIAGAQLTTWGSLLANGGLFWFNGADFEPAIPGAGLQSGGGLGDWLLNGNPTGPHSLGLLDGSDLTVGGLSAGSDTIIRAAAGSTLLIETGAAAPILAADEIAILTHGNGPVRVAASGSGDLSLNGGSAVEIIAPGTSVAETLTAPNQHAIFEVVSATKGSFPIPRLTLAEIATLGSLIGVGDAGMMVYATDYTPPQIFVWNGATWAPLPSALGTWGVDASLSGGGSGVPQYLRAGSGPVSSVTPVVPIQLTIQVGKPLSQMSWSFIGDAANVGGQGVTFSLELSGDNGATWAPVAGAASTIQPTNGTTSADFVSFTPVTIGLGGQIRAVATMSMDLTAPLTMVQMAAG